MLPLSELIALIQFEVQKSFEFSEQLMFDLSGKQESVLQLAVDVVELDLPVRFSMGSRPIGAATSVSPVKANLVLQQLDAPFLGRLTADSLRPQEAVDSDVNPSRKVRSAKPEAPKEAKELLLEVGGEALATGDAKMMFPIGKLRLVLKPVMK